MDRLLEFHIWGFWRVGIHSSLHRAPPIKLKILGKGKGVAVSQLAELRAGDEAPDLPAAERRVGTVGEEDVARPSRRAVPLWEEVEGSAPPP